MRSTVYDAVTSADPDQQLTTGEAAALLSSTRQHVADLCDRGDLPFTLVGRHRRVRRGDVDAIRTRSERLTRDQRRSLWLAYATAGRIVADPQRAIELAQVARFMRNRRCFASLDVGYARVLEDPRAEARRVNAFLGGHLDVERMAAIADRSLYRNRR